MAGDEKRMTLLRSMDGIFYEVPSEALAQYAVEPARLKDILGGLQAGPGQVSGEPSGPPPGPREAGGGMYPPGGRKPGRGNGDIIVNINIPPFGDDYGEGE